MLANSVFYDLGFFFDHLKKITFEIFRMRDILISCVTA